jgi:hypothetical protein
MTYLALRALQWGGPVLLIAAVHLGWEPGWLSALVMLAVSWWARGTANRHLSKRNMRAYIKAGGLSRDFSPIELDQVKL